MFAAVVGLVVVVLGILGLVYWWPSFVIVIQGALPFCFVVSGAVALIIGLSTLGSAQKKKKRQ